MNNRKWIIKIIENWPVKVLSVALALVLFVFHRLNTMTTRPLSVPLTIETNSALIVASPYPQNVRVNLRGEDNGIKSIADNDIEAYVDLTRYDTEGMYSAPVQIRRKESALNIEPLEIAVNPLKISVQLDQRINKTLSVVAQMQGRVADGFDLVSHSISPPQIVVTGPLGFLESMTEIRTDPIALDGRSSNFSTEINIANPNPFFILKGSEMAQVSCLIRPSVLVRSIDGIPIALAGLDPAFEADTGGRTGSIRIEGSQSQLDMFRPPEDFFTVDCSEISEPGAYTMPVMFNLPQRFQLLRREPEELILTVTLKNSENEEELP